MSKAEILDEISKLTPEERAEVRARLDELDDSLTPEEWAVIDQRMAAHEADPRSAIPWEEFKGRLEKQYGL
jgi:putative addiction module component (TIGR02574 family)